MIPRYGDPVDPAMQYARRPGVYAVLPRNGAMLLTRQADPDPELQLPGGGIDPGESPLQALHREVFEETGWRIAPIRRLGVFREFTFMRDYGRHAEKICHIYLARPVRRLGPPSENGHSPVWVPSEVVVDHLSNRSFRQMMARL